MLQQQKMTVAIHLWMLALLSVWALPRSMAQRPSDAIKLSVNSSAAYQQKELFLRWEPKNAETWDEGNKGGYLVRRYTTILSGTPLPDERAIDLSKITFPVVKHATEQEMQGISEEMEYGAKAIFHPDDLINSSALDSVTLLLQADELKDNARTTGLSVASLNFKYAILLGLGLNDASILPNSEYRYVICPNVLDSVTALNMQYSIVTIRTDAKGNLETIDNLHVDRDDKYIMLKWNKSKSKAYMSYNIFRREKGKGNFETVNEYPYVFSDESDSPDVLYADSLANNTIIYEYYVQGTSNFGFTGPQSATIEVKGKPRPLPIKPFIERIEEQNKGKLLISWSLPPLSYPYINTIKGFYVRRAKERDEPFVNIHPTILRNTGHQEDFKYLDMFPLGNAYYMIVAVDENDYELFSIPKMAQIVDDIAPAQPAGISGTVDLEGFAEIKWTANSEPDLLGYQILFSNNETGDYIPMTESWVTTEQFSKYVNIQSLTEEIWVKIGALDYHQNRSVLSEPYRLQLPDVIAPSNPVIVTIENTPQCVYIKWNASSSEDVARHEVQRRLLHYEGAWETIATYLPVWRADTSHCDTSLQCWMEYEYRIKAIDDAELFSYSGKGIGMKSSNYCYKSVFNPRAFFTPQLPFPRQSLALKTSKGFICLYWEFPCDYPVEEFNIYRRLSPNSPFVLVASIKPKKAIFTSYYTVVDPNDKSKTLTFGFPNATKPNKNTTPVLIDGVPQGSGGTTTYTL